MTSSLHDKSLLNATVGEEPTPDPAVQHGRRRPLLVVLVLLAILGLAIVLFNARVGPGPRIRNPHPGPNTRPRPLGVDWVSVSQFIGPILLVLVWVVAIRQSRREGRWTPTLTVLFAATLLSCLDPIMNWATYGVYSPAMLHFPESWGWASLSPTVEPVVGVLGYPLGFLVPAWITFGVYRRWIAPRRPSGSFVHRRPLLTVVLLGFVVCTVWDLMMEVSLIHIGAYGYSQVVGALSLRGGTAVQFPLYEAPFFGIVLACAPMLMWRDDTGRTLANRIAERWRPTRTAPHAGPVAVAFLIMAVVYLAYGAAFVAIRDTHSARTIARPWPFSNTKVYDPQGDYRAHGEPGPYMSGVWSGWQSAGTRRS